MTRTQEARDIDSLRDDLKLALRQLFRGVQDGDIDTVDAIESLIDAKLSESAAGRREAEDDEDEPTEELRPSSQCPTEPERKAYELALDYLQAMAGPFNQTDLDVLTTLILDERAEARDAGRKEAEAELAAAKVRIEELLRAAEERQAEMDRERSP